MKQHVVVALALLSTATSVQAQRQPLGEPAKNFVHASAIMWRSITPLVDPDTESRWFFDEPAFGVGAGVQRSFGSVLIGVDGTYARSKYERTQLTGPTLVASGNAGIATAMLTGRMGAGGGGDIGVYFGGAIGTVAYNLEDVGSWNADFALRAGGGIEYTFGPDRHVGIEWLNHWAYHEKDDISGGETQRPSMLRLNLRLGF